MKDKVLLISVAIVFCEIDGEIRWFIVKQNDTDGWEFAKTVVRKVESSVRASIRTMAELGAMNAKVYEEVGRGGGAAKVNGKPVAQRFIYYLMEYLEVGENENLGFIDSQWMNYTKANRNLTIKRDKTMLANARVIYKELKKKGAFIKEEEVVKEEVKEVKKNK